MRVRGVSLLACALAACGLSVTGVAPEESATGTDAGHADATTASPSDSSVTDSTISENDSGKPATGFCATLAPAPTFCEDFDTAPDAADGWDGRTGSVQRTTNQSKSTPGALDVVSGGGEALLDKDFEVTSSITLELDVRFSTIPPSGALSPFVLRPSNGEGGYVYLYVKSDRTYMQVSSDEYSKWLTPPTPAAWHHITASVTFDAAKTTFAGTFDGVAFDWSSVAKTSHAWEIAQTVTVRVGANPYQTGGEIFIDNVVVNVK